ncbi:DUF1772 domain-containing protein [Actinomadura rubrisoli]|uniref:DUF1772 domain-containing protein n=1 Tax=Actinomadura rubrisoli TaxID=2530368 RepID=A0A4R4ZPZ5_9ACTN|nr:anthrone oxygenase family protein [Actinomadura rubrisoli]TDD60236.1 DUF1772 domain-containing protein [Actinomadura rubrisoli]
MFRALMALRVCLVAALLTMGAIAGFFYAYEVSVTRGLARVDDGTYVTGMKAINAVVRNAPFAASFFGAPILTLAALILAAAALGRRSPVVWLAAAAFAVYAVGGFGITMTQNVPLNEHLATVSATPGGSLAAERADYESAWNDWNTIRTLASLAAFALLAAATTLLPGGGRADA